MARRRHDTAFLRAVGARIQQARNARGITQEILAEMLDIEAVTVSRLERGDRAVSLTTLADLAAALRIPIGDLLDDTRPLPEPERSPEEEELLRLFASQDEAGRQRILRVVRELVRGP